MISTKSSLRAFVFSCLAASVLTCTSSQAGACSTPVYRYALERWDCDYYQLVIFSNGPLTKEQKAMLDPIEEIGDIDPIPNIEIIQGDLDKIFPQQKPAQNAGEDAAEGENLFRQRGIDLKKIYTDLPPTLALMYPPRMQIAKPIWTAPLTKTNMKSLLFSPARQELVRRIILGHACVWVLLESGDKKADDLAYAQLAKSLKELTKLYRTPEEEEEEEEAVDEEKPKTSARAYDEYGEYEDSEKLPPIEFSIIRLKHDDPKEKVFASILINATKFDDDKDTKAEPMAFPFFGRGRIYSYRKGKDICKEDIEDITFYVLGACSCEIKWDNPGFDMLISADWDGLISGYITPPKKPVDLTSIPSLLSVDGEIEIDDKTTTKSSTSADDSPSDEECTLEGDWCGTIATARDTPSTTHKNAIGFFATTPWVLYLAIGVVAMLTALTTVAILLLKRLGSNE